MKRKSPIALKLAKSSNSAIMAAIEIHNKPQISYRYEIVVLLIINAWELLLKAYIYKELKNVKLFNADGTTKPFIDCVNCVFGNLGKKYFPTKENIQLLYQYRNKIAHFYTGILDPIIFLLVKKSIIFYSKFLENHFNMKVASGSNLYLLPIGFKPLYTPVEYLSKHSDIGKNPPVIQAFIDNILNISKDLHSEGIEESIVSDFNINIANVNRVKNADIVVALQEEPVEGSRSLVINKNINIVDEAEGSQSKVVITRDKSVSTGVLMHEELSENLFEEINNIISANKLMSPNSNKFHLGEEVYYRIYAEREHVNQKEETQVLLAKTALTKYYAPGIYWFLNLEANICASLILDFVESMRHPHVHAFLRLVVLLGDHAVKWLESVLDKRFNQISQPPTYYWSFKEMIKNRGNKQERRLLALRLSINYRLELPDNDKPFKVDDLLNNYELASQYLSKSCINVFNGNKSERDLARVLDVLTYGKLLEEKADSIMQALKQ